MRQEVLTAGNHFEAVRVQRDVQFSKFVVRDFETSGERDWRIDKNRRFSHQPHEKRLVPAKSSPVGVARHAEQAKNYSSHGLVLRYPAIG